MLFYYLVFDGTIFFWEQVRAPWRQLQWDHLSQRQLDDSNPEQVVRTSKNNVYFPDIVSITIEYSKKRPVFEWYIPAVSWIPLYVIDKHIYGVQQDEWIIITYSYRQQGRIQSGRKAQGATKQNNILSLKPLFHYIYEWSF